MRPIFRLILLVFLTVSMTSYSQKDYIDGHIILNDGQVLNGKIKDRKTGSFGKLYDKIRFKPKKGRTKKYSPTDILGYKKGDEQFVSMWFQENGKIINQEVQSIKGFGEKIFIKEVVKNYLSFCHLEYINEDGHLDFVAYFKRQNESLMVMARYGIFGLNKKQLITYFRDCPTLQEKIKTKEFTNPYEVIVFYNDWYSKK